MDEGARKKHLMVFIDTIDMYFVAYIMNSRQHQFNLGLFGRKNKVRHLGWFSTFFGQIIFKNERNSEIQFEITIMQNSQTSLAGFDGIKCHNFINLTYV